MRASTPYRWQTQVANSNSVLPLTQNQTSVSTSLAHLRNSTGSQFCTGNRLIVQYCASFLRGIYEAGQLLQVFEHLQFADVTPVATSSSATSRNLATSYLFGPIGEFRDTDAGLAVACNLLPSIAVVNFRIPSLLLYAVIHGTYNAIPLRRLSPMQRRDYTQTTVYKCWPV